VICRRRGTSGITYHHGDFLELAETIPPADIVTLDRVINVYPDWKRLIQVSAARARRPHPLPVRLTARFGAIASPRDGHAK
jgi:hypothetical protein